MAVVPERPPQKIIILAADLDDALDFALLRRLGRPDVVVSTWPGHLMVLNEAGYFDRLFVTPMFHFHEKADAILASVQTRLKREVSR